MYKQPQIISENSSNWKKLIEKNRNEKNINQKKIFQKFIQISIKLFIILYLFSL
jgi:hypothetical protein